jgi:hypothetical protein
MPRTSAMKVIQFGLKSIMDNKKETTAFEKFTLEIISVLPSEWQSY